MKTDGGESRINRQCMLANQVQILTHVVAPHNPGKESSRKLHPLRRRLRDARTPCRKAILVHRHRRRRLYGSVTGGAGAFGKNTRSSGQFSLIRALSSPYKSSSNCGGANAASRMYFFVAWIILMPSALRLRASSVSRSDISPGGTFQS
jgi:hypothetical protein